jgi:hypothetical protein
MIDVVIPSEVEAATQPRKLSGRGQAFNLVAKRKVISRDPSTPPACAGSAQDDNTRKQRAFKIAKEQLSIRNREIR